MTDDDLTLSGHDECRQRVDFIPCPTFVRVTMNKLCISLILIFSAISLNCALNLCEKCVKEKKVFLVLPNFSLICAKNETDYVHKTIHRDFESCKLAERIVEKRGKKNILVFILC